MSGTTLLWPWPAAPGTRTKTGHSSLIISILRWSLRTFSYFYIYYWKLPSEQENKAIQKSSSNHPQLLHCARSRQINFICTGLFRREIGSLHCQTEILQVPREYEGYWHIIIIISHYLVIKEFFNWKVAWKFPLCLFLFLNGEKRSDGEPHSLQCLRDHFLSKLHLNTTTGWTTPQ